MKLFSTVVILLICAQQLRAQQPVKWVHLSSKTGDIEAPNTGGQQTSTAVADFDNDGINDFCVTERTQVPAMVWYQRKASGGWNKFIVEDQKLLIEAGTVACDVDGDGDMDIVGGADGDFNNEVWWWENPYPNFNPKTPWTRYTIHTKGKKYHDQMIGDFDGDGKMDIVFWSQNEQSLYFARIPSHPKETAAWKCIPIFHYFEDGEMKQRGKGFQWKMTNEHEGLSKADVDGDGIMDIVGGGNWFKYLGNDQFSNNTVDAGYSFSRSAVGQLINGGRPEVIFVVGDGWGPMNLYEYKNHIWEPKKLIDSVVNGHSLAIIDFDGDGNNDIWNAEMTLDGHKSAINHILLGDGKGNFPREIKVSEGIDLHESEMADLDGDGDLDILGKPYDGDVPRLDIWLQNGTGEIVSKRAGAFNQPVGLEIYSLRFELQKDVPGTLAKMKQMGFKEVEVSGYYGKTPKEFKKLLDQSSLKCGSMIFDYDRFEKNIEEVIAEAKMFGAKYVGIGWIPHDKDFNKAKAEKAIVDFNQFGAKLKKAGLRFFYHPHGYEFCTSDGNLMDMILEQTKADLVTFQLDVFWAIHGGADPIKLMKKYPGRFELMHVKELRRDTPGNNTGEAPDETSVSLGMGATNWPALLRQAVKSGVKKYYIEDEAKNAIDQIPPTLVYLNSLK